MQLVLFDIDGTLVDTGGAGGRAFSRALEQTFGLPGGLKGVRLDGKTDFQIVREVFDSRDMNFDVFEESAPELFERYIGYLEKELGKAGNCYAVLPGVHELLVALDRDPEVLLGLASGNIDQGARLKLRKGGLDGFFQVGGFGSDSESRTELIRAASRRAARYVGSSQINSVVVVGDTPSDIVHGHQAGAAVIAVASGCYTLAQLEEYRPELAVQNLSPNEPVLELLQKVSRRAAGE